MLKNVQALRALAALYVVNLHLGELLRPFGVPAVGGVGVDLFFVISGFIMVFTTRTAPPRGRDFALSRIARIVPLYWVMTLVVFGMACLAPGLLQATSTDLSQLVRSLLFIPFRKPDGLVQPDLFVGWTLNYEMFFYGLFALALTGGPARYRLGLSMLMVLLVALVLAGALFRPSGVLAGFYTSPRLLDFALGMAIGLYAGLVPQPPPGMAIGLAGIVIASAAVLLMVPVLCPPALRPFMAGSLSGVILLDAVVLERAGWALKMPAILAVGDSSYALYLSHAFATVPALAIARRLHPPLGLSLVLLAIAFLSAVLLGLLLHHGVEAPLSRLARHLLMPRRRAALFAGATETAS